MMHRNRIVVDMLRMVDLGASVAEADTLLESARIETSAFADLLNDRVDLVPGTKGSGKSALFRIFVDFLPDLLLSQRKVVVAHGVQAPGDPVFHAFTEQFTCLSEAEFVNFWCIYLISLAHEQFIKGARYTQLLKGATSEIGRFRRACADARIPEIPARKSLREILEWSLHVLTSWRPKVSFSPSDGSGEYTLDLFGTASPTPPKSEQTGADQALPKYVNEIRESLDGVLMKSELCLWLMVDRLDEIFPRRSDVETKALRGLLRAMRYFGSGYVRLKVFLRDDMLDQIVRGENGFTALTHVTVRQADRLKWTEEQILAMIVKRFFANNALARYLEVSREQLEASATYRQECFYRLFPGTVFRGPKQSPTMRWIYNRCADGRGVVTPRDVLDLLIRAKQRQQDVCAADTEGTTAAVIGSAALQYGLEEMSMRKRQTYLQAEFPHLWEHMQRFVGGKSDYSATSLRALLGPDWKGTTEVLVSIGFLSLGTKRGEKVYSVPFLYRHGMELTQGKA
ncbi:MAG: hypothetical protein JXA57_19560 [Armatimonadetes bacterium]|nr:hypothetical protein [Armatimonadota bacterium]